MWYERGNLVVVGLGGIDIDVRVRAWEIWMFARNCSFGRGM